MLIKIATDAQSWYDAKLLIFITEFSADESSLFRSFSNFGAAVANNHLTF